MRCILIGFAIKRNEKKRWKNTQLFDDAVKLLLSKYYLTETDRKKCRIPMTTKNSCYVKNLKKKNERVLLTIVVLFHPDLN